MRAILPAAARVRARYQTCCGAHLVQRFADLPGVEHVAQTLVARSSLRIGRDDEVPLRAEFHRIDLAADTRGTAPAPAHRSRPARGRALLAASVALCAAQVAADTIAAPRGGNRAGSRPSVSTSMIAATSDRGATDPASRSELVRLRNSARRFVEDDPCAPRASSCACSANNAAGRLCSRIDSGQAGDAASALPILAERCAAHACAAAATQPSQPARDSSRATRRSFTASLQRQAATTFAARS